KVRLDRSRTARFLLLLAPRHVLAEHRGLGLGLAVVGPIGLSERRRRAERADEYGGNHEPHLGNPFIGARELGQPQTLPGRRSSQSRRGWPRSVRNDTPVAPGVQSL